jgi:hypothetical protein
MRALDDRLLRASLSPPHSGCGGNNNSRHNTDAPHPENADDDQFLPTNAEHSHQLLRSVRSAKIPLILASIIGSTKHQTATPG